MWGTTKKIKVSNCTGHQISVKISISQFHVSSFSGGIKAFKAGVNGSADIQIEIEKQGFVYMDDHSWNEFTVPDNSSTCFVTVVGPDGEVLVGNKACETTWGSYYT